MAEFIIGILAFENGINRYSPEGYANRDDAIRRYLHVSHAKDMGVTSIYRKGMPVDIDDLMAESRTENRARNRHPRFRGTPLGSSDCSSLAFITI